jgi:predicted PurR-regulated permease PerM
VALVVGSLSAITLWFFDLPFWLIIGIATGLLNLIPFVGPFFGAVLAATVALVEGRPGVAVGIVLAFTLIQQIDNHIITPMIQRTRVRLSPLIIVLALLAGGSIAGLLGVVVAVPTVTVLRIGLGHLWRTRILGESWAEATEAMLERTEPSDRLRVSGRKRAAAQAKLFDTMELDAAQLDPEPVTVPTESGSHER